MIIIICALLWDDDYDCDNFCCFIIIIIVVVLMIIFLSCFCFCCLFLVSVSDCEIRVEIGGEKKIKQNKRVESS